MARKTKPLTDTGIRRGKVPDGKRDLTLYDGDGLTVRYYLPGTVIRCYYQCHIDKRTEVVNAYQIF